MKFSFFTDIHLTDNTPKYRIDKYPETLVNKLRSVYDLSLENGCECVAFGGDFFDRKTIDDYSIIKAAINIINESGLRTYACIGEHDLYGHNKDTFPESALAFLCGFAPDFINLWNPVHLDNGVSFYSKHEWEKMDDLGTIKVGPSRYNVLLCHELLYNKKMPFGITNTADLDLQFDLVCSGDLHCGFNPHKVKNTWYCNPGSLARKSTSDIKRMPRFFIIDVQKGYDPVIISKYLPFKAGNEVFAKGLVDIIKDYDSEYDMTNFVSSFDELKVERTDIYELFMKYRTTHEVKKDVIEYIESLKNKQK